MSVVVQRQDSQIDQFFNGPGAHANQLRDFVETAQAWSSRRERRVKFEATILALAVTEEFFYPGPHLIAALRESVAEDDSHSTSIS